MSDDPVSGGVRISATDVAGVREGEVLAGKYRVERVLGVGGMGVVVAAHHIDLDERVALKFLLPSVLGQGEAVARFAREARAAVKIKSEHVAKVTDVGKLENGSPYMVMEYLEGSDLGAWLAQRGPLPIEQAADFVLQACEAIAEAHVLGIVHRDLKPGNLFVIRRPDGVLSVKVLDFGISKTTGLGGSGGPAMTKTSALMGSPHYMSPEQMQSSRDVDSRSDIWALGVILYEFLTGTPPFLAETMPELVLRVVHGAPPAAIRGQRPDTPPGLEAVILRCLERDRGRRYESIGELAAALLPFASRRSKASVERISGVMRAAGLSATALALPPSSDGNTPATSIGTAASWGRTSGPKKRTPWLVLGALGATLALAGIGWRVTRGEISPSTSANSQLDAQATAPVPPVPPSIVTPTSAMPPPVDTAAAPIAPVPLPVIAPIQSAAPVAGDAKPGSPAAPARRTSTPVAHSKTARPSAAATPGAGAQAPTPVPAPRPAEDKPNIFDDRK